ncbi:hypothetical protein ACWF76_25280 [Streptomyces globisporus]|uniref:hypothetical protein n=1 Tax=Streptomyces globisporus TaxID=1908 RepID=UPI0014050F6E|nr:hypothetical protein [Streptomyces globisporus]
MTYALFAFFALGAAVMSTKAAQLWNDADRVDEIMRSFTFLPLGPAAKRGEVRSLGLTAASLWGVALLMMLAAVDSDLSGPALVGFGVAVLLVLVSLALEFAVVLFNAPKFVVPPHMRADAGVLNRRRVESG